VPPRLFPVKRLGRSAGSAHRLHRRTPLVAVRSQAEQEASGVLRTAGAHATAAGAALTGSALPGAALAAAIRGEGRPHGVAEFLGLSEDGRRLGGRQDCVDLLRRGRNIQGPVVEAIDGGWTLAW